MEESDKITDTAAVVGGKRKNGHKMDCCCHICENMTKKAKRGGYKVDAQKRMLQKMGGSKKKNGHRMDCGCPICKNMRKSKKGGARKSARKSKSRGRSSGRSRRRSQRRTQKRN